MAALFLLFILPLALLLYVEFSEINKWIDFTQKERMGVEYNRSLRKLMEDLMHHRGMINAFLSGDPSFSDSIETEHSRIEDGIRAVDSINNRYGRLLKIDDKWESFKKSWQEREYTEYTSSARESFDSHTALIADITSLISHVAETSNLILDPEITTYYLMDCTTFKLPMLLENIGQTRGAGVRAAVTRSITHDEKDQLMVLSGIIRSSLDQTNERVQKVFLSRPDLRPELDNYARELDTTVNDFLDTLDKEFISAGEIAIKPSSYYEAATKAIDAGFNLYDKASPFLDNLLQARIYEDQKEKYLFGSVMAAVSAIFIYVFAVFIRNHNRLEVAEENLKLKVKEEKELSEFIQNILNSQDEILVITDGTGLRYANKSFLDFFGSEYLEEFLQAHHCICQMFIKEDGFVYAECDRCPDILAGENREGFKVKMFDAKKGQNRVFIARTRLFNREKNLSLITFTDITNIETESKRLKYLSETDPLTGIYNRLKFNSALEIEIARARRHNRVFSLIMFDIDHFKGVNDNFGHEAGDGVLKTLTHTISWHVRITDTFARWGGEEFMILVVETPLEGARLFAEKLRKEIEGSDSDAAGKITCSFGVTEFRETDDITSITKRVDDALYEAKNSGRNRVCAR